MKSDPTIQLEFVVLTVVFSYLGLLGAIVLLVGLIWFGVTADKAENAKLKNTAGMIAVSGLVVLFVGGAGAKLSKPDQQDKSDSNDQAFVACKKDWRQCKDNGEVVSHHFATWEISKACVAAANRTAKFGTPQWNIISFGHYYTGDDYVKTGVAVFMEDDVQFQNAFGAMQHVEVTCTYDLEHDAVTKISVN
jgi:hypothetical protein